MRLLRRSFETRLERRIALLFFGFCMVPLVVLTGFSVRAIEGQTLEVARRHLTEHSKRYAMHLVDRLDMAAWELRQTPEAGAAASGTGRWIRPLPAPVAAVTGDRVTLARRDDGFVITLADGGRVRSGVLADEVLFARLDQAPFGVRTCVRVDGRVGRCAGERPSGPVLRSQWALPLATMYHSEEVIEVISTQPREVVLAEIGVLYQVLPYVVLAIMGIGGWWVVSQLRARFAPVAELRRAAERIERGDYSGGVEIRSGDELEGLGAAFNAMTRRLYRSFTTMRALAEMDRMVLDGTHLEDLAKRSLCLLDHLGYPDGVAWLWDRESRTSDLYRLNAQRTLVHESREVATAPETVAAATAALFAEAPSGESQPGCGILRDGVLSGVVTCGLSAGAQDPTGTLVEVGDRMSVAATLDSRARALFRQAHYDGLTGLLNREAFNERLQRAADSGRRSGERGALICLDLDRFKQVNDTQGHHVGDRLLKRIGERLRGAVRGSDEVARLGGDEFAVLTGRFEQPSEIELLCRRLLAEIDRPVNIDGLVHVTEASMGVAVFPDDGHHAAELMRMADVAMYKAKEQSGSAFAFFDAGMNSETEQRAEIESRLRQGLRKRELCLYFQPKIRARDGRVVGVEGLLRWPASPEMSPGRFIPVAEQTGLIHDVTRILVEDGKACLERCREAGFDIERVAVNVSPRQFQRGGRGGFAATFLELLEANRASPEDFEIEVTESIMVDDPRSVAEELTLLRSAGVTVALDDFGTGYSSLNVLRQLPLDVIKIDRSFVAPISESAQARDLIGRIIGIIRALELTSVAEGVETEREMQILSAEHCDIVQGYLFSPALPVEALLDFLGRPRKASSA